MSRDLYASLSGASSVMRQLEMLSHNVSNANTDGFKEFRMVFEDAGSGFGPMGRLYATPRAEVPSMVDGPLERTDDPYNLALRGRGFFSVQTPQGERMSRAGRFSPDSEGYLVDPMGYKLLGRGGPIQVPVGEAITVTSDGIVMGSISGELDRLKLVTADDPKNLGGALWDAGGAAREATPEVVQGALEQSNVDPVRVMVELIEATRHFEAQQKVMRSSDEMDGRLNRIPGS